MTQPRSTVSFSEVDIQRLFGHEAAEDEDPVRLREYYFKSSLYDQVATDLPLRILVGHKGIGKSALFQIAMAEDRDAGQLAVLIKPNDIADIATESAPFLRVIRAWKEGLLEIIAQKAFSALGASVPDIRGKLMSFGGRLVDFLVDTFNQGDKVSVAPTKKVVLDSFLKRQKFNVYIDDLDRGWEGRKPDVMRISALLNAIRDIVNENRGVRFRISLRSDVYYLVRTSDESTDKIEGSVLWQSWSNHEIFALLVKRVETFFGRVIDERVLLKRRQSDLATFLDPIMEDHFQGHGHWQNAPMYRVLMSLIRKRPRDLVKLLTLAARNSREDNSPRIQTCHLESIFTEYSQGRIQDTINEFRSELPDIERLLLNMKPNRIERTAKEGYKYATAALIAKIRKVQETGAFRYANGQVATEKDLAAFMYKINFLTARKDEPGGVVRRYFEENRYLSSAFADFGFDWEIHPAYRWALQPETARDMYRTLELSVEEERA